MSILIYVFDPFSLLKELFIIYFNTICSEGLILKILLIGSGPESNISNLPSSGCPSGGSPKRGGEGISILPNEDSTSPKRRKVSSSGVVASFSRVDSSNTAYLNTQVIITERNFKRNCKYWQARLNKESATLAKLLEQKRSLSSDSPENNDVLRELNESHRRLVNIIRNKENYIEKYRGIFVYKGSISNAVQNQLDAAYAPLRYWVTSTSSNT